MTSTESTPVSGSRAPILISGGRVLDIDGDLDQPAVADLLIVDGRIVAVGPDAEKAGRSSAVRRIDARGKLIIPGLINAHYHSHDVMLRGMFEQLPMEAWILYSAPSNYARPSRDDVKLRTSLGAAECLLNGITTVQDMVSIVGADEDHLDGILQSYDESGLRVVLALQISDRAAADCAPFWRELPPSTISKLPGATDTRTLQRLIEDRLARVPGACTHWALGPSAPQRCSDELLRWTAELSRRHGLQVFTHVYETKPQAVLARMEYPNGSLIEHLDRFGLLNPRLTVAHGVWISGEEIARLGAARASLACNPMSNMKLLNGFAPIVQYAQSGAGIGLGCDNCSGNDAQNIFQSMKMFALFWGMYSPAGETGAAREAFKAATIGGARAMGLADEIGRLRPGFRADLVMIDLGEASYRPLNSAVRQLVYSETGKGVHTVMVDGRVVVEGRKLTTLSEADLKTRSEELRERMSEESRHLQERNAAILHDILSACEKANQYPIGFDRFLMREQ
jgi:5-methylthioadenosine/S-adenosylhomocysteine deaminase